VERVNRKTEGPDEKRNCRSGFLQTARDLPGTAPQSIHDRFFMLRIARFYG
jgi:hypothetical protein